MTPKNEIIEAMEKRFASTYPASTRRFAEWLRVELDNYEITKHQDAAVPSL